MLEALKKEVCAANLRLVTDALVIQTWGNVSGIDRKQGLVVIKPSGVSYDGVMPEHMVVVSLENGEVVEGTLNPSSDTPTHLELYRAFEGISGVVHTHSNYATAWAQARREIPVLGTTHADYFAGPIPCTRPMEPAEVKTEYEANTGKVIVERFRRLKPLEISAVLDSNHGPFTWGTSPDKAVFNAMILEHLAKLAIQTLSIESHPKPLPNEMLVKHYYRKHGPDAYYGQK